MISLLRTVNGVLSPGGARARLTILIFHRVLREPDPLLGEPDAERFEAILRNVRRWFEVIPLDRAATCLRERSLPPRALAITFDDGYADNHDVALPILRRLGLHATFFVATGYLDGGLMWNDRVIAAVRHHAGDTLEVSELQLRIPVRTLDERRSAIDTLLARIKYEPTERRETLALGVARAAALQRVPAPMMTSAQVRALSDAGMDLGAHTHRHPILAGLAPADARSEIAQSRDVLQDLTERPVRLFAYPNGRPGKDFTPQNVADVRALGFVAACTTAHGVAGAGTDPFQLPRFTPWDRSAWKFGARLARNLRATPAPVLHA
jgi:peptidoglycan/xylan/chitin deacetylase (PgdA/CDA1 family)